MRLFTRFLFSTLLFITISQTSKAQILVAGDIAFSGYTSNNATTDEFSFVLLVAVPSGTVVKFTDDAWLSTNVFQGGEETITWTTTSALPIGTEVKISGLTATLVGGGSAGSVTGTPISLSTGGDQVLAYQGTAGSPTFISGIHMNVYTTLAGDPVSTTAAAWDGAGANTASGCALPPGLTTGVNAIWIGTQDVQLSEHDNAHFNCGAAGVNLTTAAGVRAALNDQTKWLTDDAGPPGFTLPTGCAYISGPPAPVFTLQPSATTVCAGSNATFTATASNTISYQWQEDQGGGFANLSNNATYSGVTTTTLTIVTTSGMNGYVYRLVATGSSAVNSNPAILTVTPLPSNPSLLLKTPNAVSVADGTPVSATFNAGSGGTGCTDDYRYTTNGGGSYTAYTPGTNISTTGVAAGTGFVFIEGRRANCSSLCQGSYVVVAAWYVTPLPAGATTLNAGDLAFSGYSSGTDEFSFVLLKNIGTGTTVNFTDNGWQSGSSTLQSAEGTVTWVSNASYPAGTEIKIGGTTATLAAGGSAGTVTGTPLSLSTGGDQVLAYRGSSASPTFISAIHMNVYSVTAGDAGNTTAAAWDGTINAASGNSSALPTGLTTGTNAIWIGTQDVAASEFDNAKYGTCSNPATLGPITTLRAALNNQANWTKSNSAITIPTSCVYFGLGTLPTISTNPSNSTVCEGVNTSFTVVAGGATSYQWQVDQGAGFVNLSNDAVYSGVTSATLNINATPFALNGFIYRVVVTNGVGSVNSTSATLTVNPLPVNPTLAAKTPGTPTVADGTPVSATFNPGSGGTGCTDDFRYTTNGGGSYTAYTPGTNISTTGVSAGSGFVVIEGRRAACSAGCQGTYVVLASWNVTPAVAPGATTLAAGDIGFSGYTSTSANDDFSFVLLKNIGAGTIINFTDNGWLSTNVFRSGEETVTWTAPAGGLNAGTEIKISGLTATKAGGGAAGTVTGTGLLLNPTGDQILAYQGSVGSPTFISAIHMNVYTIAGGDPVNTTAAAWDGTANTSFASALPTGLTTGTNAIWIGTQGDENSQYTNARYGNCAANGVLGPISALRALLNNQANWIGDKNNPGAPSFTLPTGCNYLFAVCPVISVTNPGVTTGTVGTAFSQTFTSSGGVPTVNFTTSSTLPTGITLATTGVLSGTPTQSGTFPIVVTATDANGCTGTSATYTLVISCQTITVTNPGVSTGTAGIAFSQTFTQTGALGGATFTLNTGSLPAGLTLSIAGVLSGTPTAAGTFPITVKVTDGNGCTGISATYTLVISCPSLVTTPTPASQTICSANPITTIVLTGGPAGTTYNWTRNNTGSVTGIAASGAGDISGTLTNTTNAPVTVTFTITSTIYGCSGAPVTATVLVNPTPNAVATPSSQTICSGGTITTIALTGNVSGTVYNWTRNNTGTVTGIAASGAGDISGSLTNTTSAPVTVTFTITPTANTCGGTPITATVVVNPVPNAVATPSSQTICSGGTITTIALTGNVSGTVYNWTRNNTGTVTGIAASGAGDISGALTNTTNAPVTVTFTITPSFTNAGTTCTGTPITATVVVNPVPNAVATPSSQTICSGGTITTIALTGNVSGTVYNWTRNNTVTVTGIVASGAGDISGALTNTTNAAVTVTFTITPSFTNAGTTCTGTPITATVVVNPVPNAVATPSSQTICSAGTITTIVLSGNVAGTVYNWTRNNTGTVTGIAAGGAGNISGALTNTTNAPVTVTFTITPSFTNAGTTCTGTPITATVVVNPVPNAVATPSSQTICSGGTITTIALTGNVSGTVYNWTRNNTGTVTGIAASGAGDISGALTNTTNAAVTVTFTITPSFTNAGTTCTGTPITATVVVNPVPNAVATPSSQTICSANPITTIVLSGNVAGTVYNWTRDNTVSVTGIAASGAGNISGTLTNTTNAPVTVTFTITPSYTNAGTTCTGTPITATVLVNPTPTASAVPSSQTICSGSSITTIAITGTVSGTVFNWTRNNTGSVTGIAASGAGDISGALTNTTNAPVTVTFTITPVANGCSGTPVTATVLVNPIPNAVATPSSQTVCSANPITTIVLSGNVAGTVFNWTRNNTGTVTGIAGSGAGDISGTLTNTTNAPVTVTFTITPTANGCTGTPITATVLVNPTPTASAVPASQTTCSGAPITTIVITGTVSGTVFNWVRDNTGTVTGIAASGSGDISGSLVNTTASPITVTFTITPVANGCSGTPITATVLLNPTPDATATPSAQVICSANPITPIVITGTIAGTVFNWTRDNTGTVTGIPASGSGDISGTLTNTTNAPVTVTFTIIPTAFGCTPGAPVTATVTVNPTPIVNAIANQVVCNNASTAAVNFTGPVAGTTYTWTNNTTSIGLSATGTGNIPSFVATNPGTTPVTATITVTPATIPAPVTQTLSYTGAMQTWTVPSGVTSITIDAYGAQGADGAAGGNASAGGTGGAGSKASGTLAVTPGQVINIFVGGAGTSGTGGYNGGGNGGSTSAGGGGGATDIRYPGTSTASRLIVAGGGGGGGRGGCESVIVTGGNGGVGGNGNGVNGTDAPTPGGFAGGGFGATGSTFGAAGIGCGGFLGQPGTTGTAAGIGGDGGTGQACCCFSAPSVPGGGGGGGGAIGGGGGGGGSAGTAGCSGNDKGGGGGGAGGSSFTGGGGVSGGSIVNGVNAGNGSVVITYTPLSCTGSPKTFTITVNPTPTVNTVSNQTLCNGSATVPVNFSGAVAGTVYNWTNNTPSIGLAGSGSGNIASFTATNVTNAPITATITVTPSYTNGGTTCTGTPTTFTITVNPTPNAVATPASQTICSASAITTIVLTGNVAGTVFNWTRDNAASVTGIAASGSGNISGTLTNITNAPVTVTFTIIPTANGCPGAPITATVLVNPTPNAVATPSSQTVCSANAITTIVLSGNVSGTTFNWTRDNTVAVTGLANSGSGNIGGIPVNTTNAPVLVTYTITPTANGCPGAPITATVLVNPTPNAVATPASQTICSASAITTIVLTGNVAGTTFNWTRNNTGTVTGIAASGSGDISGTLTNTTSAPVTVTFTITPTANGCPGAPITATVLVNPTPNAVATPASQTVCSANAITTIVMSGNVTGTTYNWTRDNTATVTGIAASGSGNISGTLTNTTNAPVTVTFTITPTANGCPGAPITATVLVNPTPNAVATPSTQTVCTGVPITTIVMSGNVSGTTYNWTRNNTVNVTGIAASGSGNISGTLTNTTTTQQTVTFTITPTANGCPGAPITATVIVNPLPTVTCPANVTVNNAPNVCGANVTYPAATATGTPAPTITYSNPSGSFFPVGTTTVTVTATNVCGVATCTFTVTVLDVQAPVITCPSNITVTTPVGSCTASVVNPNPTTSDNCAVTLQTWALTGATTGSSPATGINNVGTRTFNGGVTTVTYTIKDAAGNTATCSYTVTVLDGQLPVISVQPANRTVCATTTATFSVTATNVVSYQWQAWNGTSWNNIAGATSSTLTLTNVTTSMNTNSYRVILTGLCSTVTSNAATLYVNPLPTIALTAAPWIALLPGQTTSITATVSPAGGTFVWFKNGVVVPGATGAVLGPLTIADLGTYRAVYTDPNGCVAISADIVIGPQISNNLWVYPNPNHGHFEIRFYTQSNQPVTVKIYNILGHLVYQHALTLSGGPYSSIDVNLGNIAAGIYIVKVVNSSGQELAARAIIILP